MTGKGYGRWHRKVCEAYVLNNGGYNFEFKRESGFSIVLYHGITKLDVIV